jgi:ornithine cyclodeaminase/alanine dehydrogenase
MKIIKYSDIRGLNISPNEWYNWADTVIKNKYSYTMPVKTSLHFGESYYNTMPSILSNEDIMGTKVVNRYIGRIPSLESHILLYRYSDGSFLSLMDGSYITAMRTGAVAVHSIEHFAKADFKEIGIMGFGNIGMAVMEILTEHFKNRELHIKLLRHKMQEEKVLKRFSNYKNIEFTIVDTVKDIIVDSDVIISCITFTDELLGKDEWFKSGCTVIPVHLRGFQNCDLFFDKVYGDDKGQVEGFKYFNKFKSFAETSEVLNGIKPGRTNGNERILCYSVGMSLHDIFAAGKIYALLSNKKVIEIKDIGPREKFWL